MITKEIFKKAFASARVAAGGREIEQYPGEDHNKAESQIIWNAAFAAAGSDRGAFAIANAARDALQTRQAHQRTLAERVHAWQHPFY